MAHGRAAASHVGDVLAPVALDEFRSRYWLTQPLVCRGAAARFSGLLSWPEFNDLLARHWRETARFRLARQGRDVDPADYIDAGGSTPRIRPADVVGCLRGGATLAFHAVDELHPPLRDLAESFEAIFPGDAQINIYAGCRGLHGLDLHCDEEEVFVLQVNGRKRWLLYGATIDHVARTQLDAASVPPAGATLDQILEAGDLLYIPQGCYHVALPLNEPVLHLTVGIRRSDDAHSHPGSKPRSRPAFNLPWSVTRSAPPPDGAFFLRLLAPVTVITPNGPGGPVELHCAGRGYRFPSAMQHLLDQFEAGSRRRVDEMVDALRGRIDHDGVQLLVAMLIRHHLVAVEP
jgi:cupin superfamily protein